MRRALVWCLLWPLQAAAAADPSNLAAPALASDSFAVQAIGSSDLQVTRPGSLHEASSAMGAFVKGGKLAPGAAVEVTPWDLYFNGVTWREYVENRKMRYFVNLAVSLATVGAGDVDPVRSAFAVRARLWDDSDWRLNEAALNCVRDVLGPRPDPGDAPPDSGQVVTVLPEISGEQADGLRKCHRNNTRWNASQAAAGLAMTLGSPGGAFKKTRPDGAAAWFSVGAPIGNHFQLLVTTRYAFHKAQDATDTVPAQAAAHVGGVGTRLAFYTLERLVLMLDTGLGTQRSNGEWTGRALVGGIVQVKLFGNTWGEVAAAQDIRFGHSEDNRRTITTNLRWNHDVASTLR